MSTRRELQRRLHGLGEIKEILGSMKTLSVIETRKLTRFGETQRRMLRGLERAVADFCRFYPDAVVQPPALRQAYLLLGSERGFCGDLNERLLEALAAASAGELLLAVGSRLFARLEGDPRLVAAIAGAGVVEEVPTVLSRVVEKVIDLQSEHSPLGLSVLFHDPETQEVTIRRLLPSFKELMRREPTSGAPPQLNLPAHRLCAELIDHYLFASLHEAFYAALMAENQKRVMHLEGVVRRLEEELSALGLKSNALRQEEITEEIEVILLSAQAETDGG